VDYRHLEIEKRDHIAIVTLDRPEKLNALNGRLMRELIHVSESFADDTRTRAVIFTGRGKHFCAGADLSGGTGNAGASEDDGGPDLSTRLGLRRSQRFGPNMLRSRRSTRSPSQPSTAERWVAAPASSRPVTSGSAPKARSAAIPR